MKSILVAAIAASVFVYLPRPALAITVTVKNESPSCAYLFWDVGRTRKLWPGAQTTLKADGSWMNLTASMRKSIGDHPDKCVGVQQVGGLVRTATDVEGARLRIVQYRNGEFQILRY